MQGPSRVSLENHGRNADTATALPYMGIQEIWNFYGAIRQERDFAPVGRSSERPPSRTETPAAHTVPCSDTPPFTILYTFLKYIYIL
jgi:hypothetical protein